MPYTPELIHLAELCKRVDDIRSDIEQSVARARDQGASWAQIGEALGMTKQGAQQRFSKES